MELIKHKIYKIIDRSDNAQIVYGVLDGAILSDFDNAQWYLFHTKNGSRCVALEDILGRIEIDDFISYLQKKLETEQKTNAVLRDKLLNPPPDVQEKVLDMLGIREALIKKDDMYYELRDATLKLLDVRAEILSILKKHSQDTVIILPKI